MTGSVGARPDRVLTVPNVLSGIRLLGVPLFLYLVLGPHEDGWAVLLLAVAGVTDYLDGKIARVFDQYSELGRILDPLADRLYTLATLFALLWRDGLPWWWAAGLVGRDVVLLAALPLLRSRGYPSLQVSFLGKAATFNLLYAFPMLLAALPGRDDPLATVVRPLGWAFAAWGSALYLVSGVAYLVQVRRLVQAADHPAPASAPSGDTPLPAKPHGQGDPRRAEDPVA
ncbi:MAG: CDP-alcohol phosphatidyltransferase [Frankiales bacterium]|nr:CDP-alcohol phosphatidyltransferase [Frankiales bacterium]